MREEEEGRVSVLVTGAQGCVGRHLVDCLLQDGGYNVHCLDLCIPLEKNRKKEVCSYIQADICTYEDMVLALQGIEAVFHLASITPLIDLFVSRKDYYHVNVKGTQNIVEACLKCCVERLVYTSTAAVVIEREWYQRNVDESLPYPKNPIDIYTKTKGAAERLVLAANGKYGLVTCSLRIAGTVFSIDNPVIHCRLSERVGLIKSTNYGVTISPVGPAAKAHILAEKKLQDGPSSIAAGKAYNLGNKERILNSELCGKMVSGEETIWGQPPPYLIPQWLFKVLAYVNYYCYRFTGFVLINRFFTPLALGYSTERSFSSERAHFELDWEELPPWETIVQELVKKYRYQKDKSGEEEKKEK